MRRYRVTRAYFSDQGGRRFGPWTAGSEVELSEDEAAWVNRDSPGVATPVSQQAPAPERESEPEPAPVSASARRASTRSRRGGRGQA